MTHHAGRVEEASSFACASVQPCQLLDQKNVARSQVRRAGFCRERATREAWTERLLDRSIYMPRQTFLFRYTGHHILSWQFPLELAKGNCIGTRQSQFPLAIAMCDCRC